MLEKKSFEKSSNIKVKLKGSANLKTTIFETIRTGMKSNAKDQIKSETLNLRLSFQSGETLKLMKTSKT